MAGEVRPWILCPGAPGRAGSMSRARTLVLLFLGSVLVKALTALLISQPGYMDAYYYYHVAANLASGRGFVEDFVWNYLDGPVSLPHPSNLYWLPLTSILIAPSLALLGESFRAAQISVVLVASLLPLVAFLTAEELGLSRGRSTAVGVLAVFSGVFFLYWAVPDVLAAFGVTGSVTLYCSARGMHGRWGWFVLAAAFAGLAHLARPDGVLLLAIVVTMIVVRSWLASRGGGSGHGGVNRRDAFGVAAACFGAYILVLMPWFARNLSVIGVPWPPTGEAVFQREYNDLFRYGRALDLAYYLDWGWQAIVLSKLRAAGENLIVFAQPFLFYLLPFGLAGFYGMRRSARSWPFLLYMVVLYLAMTLLFTFAGPRGSYLHSMAALLPFFLAAAVAGIEIAVHWAAGRLKHWVEPKAQRNFLAIAVVIAAALSVFLAVRSAMTWDDRFRAYERAAAWYRVNAAPGSVVMVVDPPGWHYSSGGSAVVYASEDLATNLAISRRFGVRYWLLEAAHPLGIHSFYLGEETAPELALRASLDRMRVYEFSSDGW